MYLQQILNGICYKMVGSGNPNVESLSCDTSTLKPNCLFFCLKGTKFDGHDFFRKAIGDGAVALVCEKQLNTHALQIIVDDVRQAMSLCAKNFYDNCIDKMKLVTIVGTNGKTSTSFVLDAILSKAGINTAVIGTNGIYFNGEKRCCSLTTPDPIDMHYWFNKMYLCGVQVVIMEVSAHAIALKKICGVVADVAIFTNFSQDHLDYFVTMQNYEQTKCSYFCSDYIKNAVVNVDDQLGKKICKSMPCITYGLSNEDCSCKKHLGPKVVNLYDIQGVTDITSKAVVCKQYFADGVACDVDVQIDKLSYSANVFGQNCKVKSKLTGIFNVYNTLAAMTTAMLLGVDMRTATDAIWEVDCISGRNETIFRSDGARIVVDFAHTSDGVDNVLSFLKSTCKGKLIVVFGCGGNRDKLKRPVMAEKVSKYANFAIITNDNPRFEDPNVIAQDIACRLTCQHKIVLNRSQATAYALSIATANDTIAILGKGAETYQEIKGRKFPYSDVEIVNTLIGRFAKG